MIIPPSGSNLALGATVGGATTGLLKVTSGTLAQAVAGGDYLAPTGSGAQLTGIVASQIGSVPAGIIKGAGGAFAVAAAGTDYPGLASTNTFSGANTFSSADVTIGGGNNLTFTGGGGCRANFITNVANTGAFYSFNAGSAVVSQRTAALDCLVVQGASGQSGQLITTNIDGVEPFYVTAQGVVVSKGLAPTIASKSANYTLTTSDSTVVVDASSGAVTITLPAVNSTQPGRRFTVKKTDSSGNAVTVARAGSDTIDGATSYVLPSQYRFVTIQGDASSKWWVVSSN